MNRAIDISGLRFGMLVAQRDIGKKNGGRVWLCLCDCGESHEVQAGSLTSGNTTRCSNHRNETARKTFTKHGAKANRKPTPEYAVWSLMRDRCNNPQNKSYPYYGGKGISVTPEWDDFSIFLADMGSRPLGSTIDRIDSEAGYSPANCRWATRKEQSRNRKFCTRVMWNGTEQYLWKLAEDHGIPNHTMHQRLHRGWSLERTLTQQIRSK